MEQSTKGMRFVWALLIYLGVFFVLSPGINQAAASQPTDIKNHWAKWDILSAVSEGWAYMEGQKFNPNKPATREEVVWMLVGASKTIQSSIDLNTKADMTKFKDKSSSWAEGRMAIAVGNGLIKGYPDGTIKAKAPITRAEFAVLLSRLIDDQAPAGFLPFWDYIPGWAMEGIKKAHAKGIINGYPDKSFGANKNVTKAEALVMIKRWKGGNVQHGYLSPDAPEEFKAIYEMYPNSNCGETRLYYSNNGSPESGSPIDIYLAKNSSGSQAIVLVSLSEDTLNAAKEMLKVYYPTQYEEAYQDMLKVKDSKQEISDKTYDGRSFNCFFAQYLEVKIGVEE